MLDRNPAADSLLDCFAMKYLIALFLVVASSLRLLAGDNLGSGQPGLKIIIKGQIVLLFIWTSLGPPVLAS